MAKIIQRGLVTGPEDILSALTPSTFKVRSWDNHHSPATQKATWNAAHLMGAKCESIFDAAHGRRYMLFVYRNADERKACWDYHTGAVA